VTLLLGLLTWVPTEARSATIVPPASLGDLGRRSGAVVLASAVSAEPVRRGLLLFTRTRFVVAEAVSGPASKGTEILVDAPGGEIDGSGWRVDGSPRFEPGATYLLFLAAGPEGRWQPSVLSWGLMRRVETEPFGNVLVPVDEAQHLSAMARPDGEAPERSAPFVEAPLLEHLRAVIRDGAEWNGSAFAVPEWLLPGKEEVAALAVPSGCAFLSGSGGNLRRQTFDTGGSASMSAATPGDSSLAGGGFSEVQGALAAWEGISGTSMNFSYGGAVSYSLPCTGGQQDLPGAGSNVVVFNDPCSDIADLSGCSGTLAFGGPWYSGTHAFDGTTWMTITSWFVVVNNGAGCLGSANYQRMLTHELGHGLGFGHFGDSGALMYFMCCNAINATDRTCAQYVYPGSAPPPVPVAGFTFSPASPVIGQTVSFTDTSTNSPTSRSWTFGDGGTSSSQNPTHPYATAGTFNVTLTATNASGSDSETKLVVVSGAGAAPVASFTYSPPAPAPGASVQFTDTSGGGPTAWSWNFGDPGAGVGNVSTVRNPVHVYGLAGGYTVTLTASNAFGPGTTTRSLAVASASNRAPAATPDSYTVAAGGNLSVSPPGVLGNDSDPDGDALTAVLASLPANGTLALQPSGAFVYEPSSGFVGTDSFTYRASDARGGSSAPATATILVSAADAERVVPVVLDAFGVGTSRFRSELVVVNRGGTQATVEMTYTAASALNASGSGTITETLGAGRQLVLDDALAYLRARGLLIPQAVAGASQGGSLRVRFRNLSSPDAGAAFARTTALLPEGRAGVAYPAVAPSEWQAAAGQHVFGLRESAQARSNLALVNLGSTDDVALRVTLQSGTMGDRRSYLLPETIWLRPLQWTQIGSILARAGFTNGWALVERVSGGSPFFAYGVFNDYGTNDGSFIDPIPVAAGVPSRTVPVVLELGIYSSELILTNPTASNVAVRLEYFESLAAGGVARRAGVDLLQPKEQKVVEAIPHLRALGVDIGPAGASYAGSVMATFTASGQPVNGFVGARTKSPGQPQGAYGVYYSGLGTGQEATAEAWVFGLRQDADSRSNVAVAHAEAGGAPVTLRADVFDGETGAVAGGTANVTLQPGQWFQWNEILKTSGLTQGYVRVFRVSGTSPFLAYGVVNDGGSGRSGTNDGSYVPMLPGR
jgi:PKD repeat protein